LLSTAVTLGEAANAKPAARIPAEIPIKNARPIFNQTSTIEP